MKAIISEGGQEELLRKKDGEIKSLKAQLRGMDLLMLQNAALEREVVKLCNELDDATMSIQKNGYLYKWRDKYISYASQWTSRYFTLRKNTLSYYVDSKDNRPRRTISLGRCFVRDEGLTKNGLYRVFGIYKGMLMSEVGAAENELIIRLSADNTGEAQLWIEALMDACALTPSTESESDNINKSGRIFPVESGISIAAAADVVECSQSREPREMSTESKDVHHLIGNEDGDTLVIDDPATDSNDIRQTIAASVIEDWESKTNAFSDLKVLTDGIKEEDYPLEPQDSGSISPKMLRHIASSSQILKKSQSRVSMSRKLNEAGSAPPTPILKKHSGYVPRSFPGSKNIHTQRRYAPLSSEIKPGIVNYRGFINLGGLILIATHFRLVMGDILKYGYALNRFGSSSSVSTLGWDSSIAILSWAISLTLSLVIEKVALKRIFRERYILGAHYILGTCNIVGPCLWVWYSKTHPGLCVLYLFQSVIIWMKLISFAHVNRDLRSSYREMKKIDKESSTAEFDNNAKPPSIDNIFTDMEDLEPPYLHYPRNLTPKNLLYFCVAPTLCYQLNYPRSSEVRLQYISFILFRLLLVGCIILLTVEQYIVPTLVGSVAAVKDVNIFQIVESLLALSLPSSYVWILSFYWYFHLWLNLLAELTRFGDREFYKDWWNARTIEAYWRLWNLPVHNWMLRHLYYPMIRSGISKTIATLGVFLFSAAFHEIVISIPFRHISMHAFFGMLGQAPLVFFTKYLDKRFENPVIGNIIFWCTFCIIGQPMGAMLVYFDLCKNAAPQI